MTVPHIHKKMRFFWGKRRLDGKEKKYPQADSNWRGNLLCSRFSSSLSPLLSSSLSSYSSALSSHRFEEFSNVPACMFSVNIVIYVSLSGRDCSWKKPIACPTKEIWSKMLFYKWFWKVVTILSIHGIEVLLNNKTKSKCTLFAHPLGKNILQGTFVRYTVKSSILCNFLWL